MQEISGQIYFNDRHDLVDWVPSDLGSAGASSGKKKAQSAPNEVDSRYV